MLECVYFVSLRILLISRKLYVSVSIKVAFLTYFKDDLIFAKDSRTLLEVDFGSSEAYRRFSAQHFQAGLSDQLP